MCVTTTKSQTKKKKTYERRVKISENYLFYLKRNKKII